MRKEGGVLLVAEGGTGCAGVSEGQRRQGQVVVGRESEWNTSCFASQTAVVPSPPDGSARCNVPSGPSPAAAKHPKAGSRPSAPHKPAPWTPPSTQTCLAPYTSDNFPPHVFAALAQPQGISCLIDKKDPKKDPVTQEKSRVQ